MDKIPCLSSAIPWVFLERTHFFPIITKSDTMALLLCRCLNNRLHFSVYLQQRWLLATSRLRNDPFWASSPLALQLGVLG